MAEANNCGAEQTPGPHTPPQIPTELLQIIAAPMVETLWPFPAAEDTEKSLQQAGFRPEVASYRPLLELGEFPPYNPLRVFRLHPTPHMVGDVGVDVYVMAARSGSPPHNPIHMLTLVEYPATSLTFSANRRCVSHPHTLGPALADAVRNYVDPGSVTSVEQVSASSFLRRLCRSRSPAATLQAASVLLRDAGMATNRGTAARWNHVMTPRLGTPTPHNHSRAMSAYAYRDRRGQIGAHVTAAVRALRAETRNTLVDYPAGAPYPTGKREARYMLLDACEYLVGLLDEAAGDTIIDRLSDEADASPWYSGDLPLERLSCGHIVSGSDERYTSDVDETFCEDCRGDVWVYLEDTSEYTRRRNAYYHEDSGEWYSYPELDDDDDDDDDYNGGGTLAGWQGTTSHLNHDRSFTPSHLGDFTMGIELEVEVDEDTRRREVVQATTEHFNAGTTRPYIVCKRDGSLDDDQGFEIVTAARRLEDHLAAFKTWEPEDLKAWDAGNCGMHVHIDSRAFSPLTLGKFMMFMNNHANATFIKSIAGRHPTTDGQAERYARTISQEYVADPLSAKLGRASPDRYHLVNLTNLGYVEQRRLGCEVNRDCKGDYSTVELRVFRATLRKSRLLAQIEFAHAAVMFCRAASWHNLTGHAFVEWLSTTQCYPRLARWFGVSKVRNKSAVNDAANSRAEAEV